MNTLQSLPGNYRQAFRFNAKDRKLLVKMNIAGFFLVILFGWIFSAVALTLRPEAAETLLSFEFTGSNAFLNLALVLVLVFVTIVLHEIIHGVSFFLFSKVRPVFGFRWVYAFAAAPGYYIPRDKYLPTALAPLVVISVVGVILMLFVPVAWLTAVLLMCVINGSGAVGDIWVAWLLLRLPRETLAHDQGDEIILYEPAVQG